MLVHALAALCVLGAGDVIHKERVVPAPVAEVWKAWTTTEGVKTFFAPDANIELREGGAYELYFSNSVPEGQRGSEGCTVVSFEANRRLTFTWNFPPSVPSLRQEDAHTNITVTLAPSGSGTKVTIDQGPFEAGDDWQAGRAYFDRAWDRVLLRLEHRFKRGVAVDFGWPFKVPALKFLAGTWKYGDEKHGGQELWVGNDNSLTGMYREVMDGKAGFYELMEISRDGDDLVLTMRMFDQGLKDAKKTAAAPLRFVLDALQGQKATFNGEGSNKASLVYELKNPHHLSVALDKQDGAPVEHFELARFFP
jgi:uncharacterized protein YndB with AHSA1/START domain